MPLYTCEACNFSSKLKANFKNHLLTKKHRVNIGELESDLGILGVKKKVNQNEPKVNQNEPVQNPMNQNEPKVNQIGSNSNEPKVNQNEPTNQNEPIFYVKKIPKNENGKYVCENCGAEFATSSSRKRHQAGRCKAPKNYEKIIQDMQDKYELEKKDLTSKIDKLLDKVGNTTNNITNNTQNIILNSYGNEDMSHITDNIKTQLLRIPYAMIPKMIEAVHFNNMKPENKNIILPNKNDKKLKVYKDNRWIFKDKEDVINTLVSNNYGLLDNHFEQAKMLGLSNIDEYVKMNYIKFRKYYTEGDDELLEKIKEECEMVMLNNRQ